MLMPRQYDGVFEVASDLPTIAFVQMDIHAAGAPAKEEHR
jgi:hypothetical protein